MFLTHSFSTNFKNKCGVALAGWGLIFQGGVVGLHSIPTTPMDNLILCGVRV